MGRKKLKTVYLYADGHAAAVWEKNDRNAGTIEWVELHERWGPRVDFIEGRLILKAELALLVKNAIRVGAKPANVECGSENTRKVGLALDTLEVTPRGADWPVCFHNIPSMLCGPWTYQPEVVETFEEVREKAVWSTMNLTKVHYRRRKKVRA